LSDEEASFGYLQQTSVQRSFPRKLKLTPEAVEVLRRVLVEHSIPCDLDDPGIKLCYLNGWLHAEAIDSLGNEIVCVLPSPLHALLVSHHLVLVQIPDKIEQGISNITMWD
jgi:hypothetical protein